MGEAGSVDVGDGSGDVPPDPAPTSPDPALPHLGSRHSKSLTSRPPLGGLDLDPIQRLVRIGLGPIRTPGRNDRRYGNRPAALRPDPIPTRSPRGPLSSEARSCAARGAGGCGVHRSVYGMVVVGYPGHVPHPPHGGGGVHDQGTPPPPCRTRTGVHPTPGTPRRARNGPLGSKASRGAPLQGIHGNTREHTGIPGNTREHRE